MTFHRLTFAVLPALLAAALATTASAQPDDSGNWNFAPDNDPAFERWQHKNTKEYVWLKKGYAEPVASSPAASSIVPRDLNTATESMPVTQPIIKAASSQPAALPQARNNSSNQNRRAISRRSNGSRKSYVAPSKSPPVQPVITSTPGIEAAAEPMQNVAKENSYPAIQQTITAPAAPPPAAPYEPPAPETPKSSPAEPINVSVDLQPVCAPDRPSSGDPRSRRPGRSTPVLRFEPEHCDPTRLPPPTRDGIKDFAAVPDRWRIVGDLGYDENLWDPYSGFNILKGDRPVTGEWFFNGLAVWDSIIEPRSFPVPVGNATTQRPGEVDLIGNGDQTVLASNLITELVYYRGDTIFRPPDWEIRFTPVFNINQVEFEERGLTNADPSVGRIRRDTHIGIQSAFVDYHIRNVSDRYDFDSIRVGIQPYNHDFRGFLFLDQPLGIRLFGTRDNNIFQYNIGAFRRIEKDTNSGLNDISMRLRNDDVFVANVFWQDLFKLGFISQFSVLYNRNREADQTIFDRNQFIARPSSLGTERARDYDVTYLGYTGDGHFGRLNLSVSTYGAFGSESNSTFNNQKSRIQAYFAAFEAGFDQDWIRYRLSFLYGSGDSDPYDDKSEGFDAVFENPIFAGADTSYWIRQTVPLIGGGRVTLSGRNGVLNSLRSSKEQGQSNFTNPGIILLGLGADLDLSTTTRLSFNANQLWFDESATVEIARNQGAVDDSIGTDLSAALIYRPFATQNVVFRLSGAVLLPGEGFKNLFGDKTHHSVLANLLLVY